MTLKDTILEAIANYPARPTGAKRGRKTSKVGSHYAVAKDSGICESALCRFVKGKQSFNLESLEALCETLRLKLQPKGSPPKVKRRDDSSLKVKIHEVSSGVK